MILSAMYLLPISKERKVSEGNLVIPVVSLSRDESTWPVSIDDDSGNSIVGFKIPREEADALLSQNILESEKSMRVRVTYSRSFFGRIIDPKIEVIAPGQIRTPK